MTEKEITDFMVNCGVSNAACIPVSKITFNRNFRKACEANSCGSFGRCWMCPPDVGDIDKLIAEAQSYKNAAVFQTIRQIEDSYDIEGMFDAGKKHVEITQKIRELIPLLAPSAVSAGKKPLLLSAGGCKVCETCAKRDEKPCPFPERALASLESYGVSVYETAQTCGMKYINGQNTVTYFGALLYN